MRQRPHPPGHLTERSFPDDQAKWAFLEVAPNLDRQDRRVLLLAMHLWEAAGAMPRAFAVLAQAYCRDAVRYATDTDQFGGEDMAPAGQVGDVISAGVDDCDAKARLFVALCLAERIPAKMIPHWQAGKLAHVSAEVTIDGRAYPVETTLARARFGEDPRDVPKETTGHWALNDAAGGK